MMRKVWILSVLLLIVATMGGMAMADTPKQSQTSTLDFTRMSHGQYIVAVKINDKGPFPFMLDTAASRSSVFIETADQLGLQVPKDETRLVNGMVTAKHRPLIRVKFLDFAHLRKSNHDLIVLNDWPLQDEAINGILGMDILDDLTLRFNHKAQTLEIGSGDGLKTRHYRKWSKVHLRDNPYRQGQYGLRFIEAGVGSRSIPAILDLGSSFSAINWRAVRNTSLDKEKARLRKEWQISGANGHFTPKLKIRLAQMQIGPLDLRETDLIVMDFNHLPVNHYGKYPLLIAGTDWLSNRDFALDFINDKLYVRTTRKDRRKQDLQHEYLQRNLRQGRMP